MALMLNSFADRVLAGGLVQTIADGSDWMAYVDGLPLIGIAGGIYRFASAANARDWVEDACARRMAGNHNDAKVQAYIAKLEVLRLKAGGAGEGGGSALAQYLAEEIAALQQLDYAEPLAGGGGSDFSRHIVLDGGWA